MIKAKRMSEPDCESGLARVFMLRGKMKSKSAIGARRPFDAVGKLCAVCVCWLSVVGLTAANPERKTIQAGGHTREYMVYLPQNVRAARPDGVIVALHGFNRTMDNFFNEYSITQVADSLNYLILSPQALPEQDAMISGKAEVFNLFLNDKIKLDAVWGCGLRVKIVWGITLLDEELNKNVDDVDFIRTMIERALDENAMPAENIFFVGTSMGGYMAYQYAMRQPVQASGIVSIAGSMGLDIKGAELGRQTPVCDFHSLTDEVVPYAGSYKEGGATVTLAQDKANVIRYWTDVNGAGAPVVENVDYYPSTNGITVEKITYPHPENEVVHYKIDGAGHSYFFRRESGDCMDYVEEIGKFIASHSVTHAEGKEPVDTQKPAVYPNPASDIVYFGWTAGDVFVYDLTGKLVLSTSFHSGSVNISSLKQGAYIFRIHSEGRVHTAKVLKR
jgi:poly(3-hydroxybutyrate) depolymerase